MRSERDLGELTPGIVGSEIRLGFGGGSESSKSANRYTRARYAQRRPGGGVSTEESHDLRWSE